MKVNIREVINKLMYLISVPKCVYCNTILEYGDRALCKSCLKEYIIETDRQCSRCARKLSACHCANHYLEQNGVKYLSKCFRYRAGNENSRANALVYSLKQDYRRDTVDFIVDEMLDAARTSLSITSIQGNTVVTFVPRRRTSYNKYGYDHAKLLAKGISRGLAVELIEPLRSVSKKAQKEMIGADRLHNAKFKINKGFKHRLDGKTVILIDDIVTTGASFVACAKILKSLGAKRIVGIVYSVAFKDSTDRTKK